MSSWINKTIKLKDNLDRDKPCHKLKYCPYGQLVEEYPIKKTRTKYSCKLFGHDCPMFYQAEDARE